MNLERTRAALRRSELSGAERKIARERADKPWAIVKGTPKSRSWKAWDRIGETQASV